MFTKIWCLFYLSAVSLLGLQEGLHDDLLMEHAVAILGTGEQLPGVGLAGGAGLLEVLVQRKCKFAGANLRPRARSWRVIDAGAKRVAHKASEQAVAFAACQTRSRWAPGLRRGRRPLENRNGAVVMQVPPLERRRRVGAGVGVTTTGDALVIGSVVPQRGELVVSRGARRRRRRGRRGEEAREAAASGGQAVGGGRRRGRSGGTRKRTTGARVELRRIHRARRTGVQGNGR
jgi:hypothetical protein